MTATAQSDQQPKIGKMRLSCPHCNSAARIRHSRSLSPLYRDGILECQNIADCGWRGRVCIEIACTLTPSAQPSPDINLPVSSYVLPSSPYALPVNQRIKTKNPNDPHRDQQDLFSNK